jgi:hypothetical protein
MCAEAAGQCTITLAIVRACTLPPPFDTHTHTQAAMAMANLLNDYNVCDNCVEAVAKLPDTHTHTHTHIHTHAHTHTHTHTHAGRHG